MRIRRRRIVSLLLPEAELERSCDAGRARYLLVSTTRFPELAEQLDTGTILAMKGPADGWAFPSDTAGDYLALTLEAIEADPGS